MGGAWFHETYGAPETVTEESLLPIATQAVRSQLGITAAPRWSRVMLHRVGHRWSECMRASALAHGGVEERTLTTSKKTFKSSDNFSIFLTFSTALPFRKSLSQVNHLHLLLLSIFSNQLFSLFTI